MPEEFSEYRRRTRRQTERKTHRKAFSKKLLYQLLFSAIIFSFVFIVKTAKTPLLNKIDTQLKKAFTYKVDTSIVTDTIENILKNSQNKGEIPDETKVQQNSQNQDI